MTGWAGFWIMVGMITSAEIVMEYLKKMQKEKLDRTYPEMQRRY
jgi:hypothetical protein